MTHYAFTDHKEQAKDEAAELMFGNLIGEGAHRRVYAVRDDATVIKMERASHEFANVREWLVWDEAQWLPDAKRWLAPCLGISKSGLALTQTRCRDLTDGEWEALKLVPAWLGDTKRDNWGWLEDPEEPRPVMRDYSITRLEHFGHIRGKRLVEKDQTR